MLGLRTKSSRKRVLATTFLPARDFIAIKHGPVRHASLSLTVSAASPLLAPLYGDALRTKLLETGKGVLRLAIGRSAAARISFPGADA